MSRILQILSVSIKLSRQKDTEKYKSGFFIQEAGLGRINPWPPFDGGSVPLFSVSASSANRHAPYVNVARVFHQREVAANSEATGMLRKEFTRYTAFSPWDLVKRAFEESRCAVCR